MTPTLPKEYRIVRQMDDTFLSQLIRHTNADSEIQRFTRDPSRFSSKEQYEQWIAKRREIFILASDGALCGFGWCSEQDFPQEISQECSAKLTLAVRIYPPFRGKGLSVPFFASMIQLLDKERPFGEVHDDGYWLRRRAENEVAAKIYEACNFQEVARTSRDVYLVRTASV